MSISFMQRFYQAPKVTLINVGDAIKSQKQVFEKFAKKKRVDLMVSKNNILTVKDRDSYTVYVTKPSKKGNTGYASFCTAKDLGIEQLMAKMNEAMLAATAWVRPFGTLKDKFLRLFQINKL